MSIPSTAEIYSLLDSTLSKLVQPSSDTSCPWLDFLHTAAWNYKYPFTAQVLIYAQRPNATACGTKVFWESKKMHHRQIHPGAKGISILKDQAFAVETLYDITDTIASPDAPQVPIWHMTTEKSSAVKRDLLRTYALDIETEETLPEVLLRIASKIVQERFNTLIPGNITTNAEKAFLGLSDGNTRSQAKAFLTNSVFTAAMLRCALDPNLPPDAYSFVSHLNASALKVIGNAGQVMAHELIKHISRAVNNYDKALSMQITEKDILHALRLGSRLQDSKFRIAFSSAKSMWDLEQALPEEYGTDLKDVIQLHYPDHKRGSIVPDAKGLYFNKARAKSIFLPWSTIADRITDDLETGTYLNPAESAHFDTWITAQITKNERIQLGEALGIALRMHNREGEFGSFASIAETIRAYAYENSTDAEDLILSYLDTLLNHSLNIENRQQITGLQTRVRELRDFETGKSALLQGENYLIMRSSDYESGPASSESHTSSMKNILRKNISRTQAEQLYSKFSTFSQKNVENKSTVKQVSNTEKIVKNTIECRSFEAENASASSAVHVPPLSSLDMSASSDHPNTSLSSLEELLQKPRPKQHANRTTPVKHNKNQQKN